MIEFESIENLKTTTQYIPIDRRGRTNLLHEKHLFIALWYYSNQDSYREISNLFGVTESITHAVIRRITEWIVNDLMPTFIKWPNAVEQSVRE